MYDWWATPVGFGDWRNVPSCDFVTNVPTHRWYSGKEAGNFRPGLLDEFGTRLRNGDTVTVGIDYYGTLPAFTGFLPDEVLRMYGRYLENGGVLRLKAWIDGDKIMWEL